MVAAGSRSGQDVEEIAGALVRLGLCEPAAVLVLEPLAGGVSSDIFRIGTPSGPVVVKRARPTLRTASPWHVSVERNRHEYAWLEVAGRVIPDSVPTLLGRDDVAGLFAMSYFDPVDNPVWKPELVAGRIDAAMATAVGDRLGRLHAATADDPALATRFATDDLFAALRLDPYLTATAAVHGDLADRILALRDRTATIRRVLVHGDVSPKNLLVGPHGPVFLDAECAWFGDPAFDLAFCTNHLVLKSIWLPDLRDSLVAASGVLIAAYLQHVAWEQARNLEQRAATLLPALMLARVDGTSPVEYLDDASRERVRRRAADLLIHGPDELAAVVVAATDGGSGG